MKIYAELRDAVSRRPWGYCFMYRSMLMNFSPKVLLSCALLQSTSLVLLHLQAMQSPLMVVLFCV